MEQELESDAIDPLAGATEEVQMAPVAPASDIPLPSEYRDPVTPSNSHSRDKTLIVSSDRYDYDAVDAQISEYRSSLKPGDSKLPADRIIELKSILSDFVDIVQTGYDNQEFESTVDDPSKDFSQVITNAEGRRLRTKSIQYSVNEDAEELNDETDDRYLASITGVGDTTEIMLWHSGVIVVVSSFRESRILDLNLTLSKHRVGLGNLTRGAVFSGDDVYVVGVIIDFILGHVIDCNMKGWTMDKLRSIILVHDIHSLLTGALAAIYPGGYPILHSCKNRLSIGKEHCDYNIKAERHIDGSYLPDGLLDFTKMSWADKNTLNTASRTHMSGDLNSSTKASILLYQQTMTDRFVSDPVEIWNGNGRSILIQFQVPTIKTYNKLCKGWVSDVTNLVDSAMNIDSEGGIDERRERRNLMMISYGITLNLLKQSNWISYISIVESNGRSRVINTDSSIRKALEVFAEIDGFPEQFDESVMEYKERTTISLSGLPNFRCPSCGKGQTEPDSKHPTLIPINMVGYFFTIMEWRGTVRH